MRRIEASYTKQDAKALRFTQAKREDFDELVEDAAQVYVDGQLRVHFEPLPTVPADLLHAMETISYGETYRTAGLKTQSKTLGYLPRVTVRRDFCTESTLAVQSPEASAIFRQYAYKADARYFEVNPALYEKARGLVSKVLPCWRMGSSVFTSGIVNKDNALFYHLDSGNFRDVWSAMYALSLDCPGGHLSVPELNIGFSFQRPALIMFDGQGLIHGVTPLEKRSKAAYRYSVVYYAMQQLCHCGTPEEELERIRKVKTAREVRRSKA